MKWDPHVTASGFARRSCALLALKQRVRQDWQPSKALPAALNLKLTGRIVAVRRLGERLVAPGMLVKGGIEVGAVCKLSPALVQQDARRARHHRGQGRLPDQMPQRIILP